MPILGGADENGYDDGIHSRWEYRLLSLHEITTGDDSVVELINNLGWWGWEIKTSIGHYAILQRRVAS